MNWHVNEDIDEEDEKYCYELVKLLQELLLKNSEIDKKKYELQNNISNLLTNIPSKCLISLKLNYQNQTTDVIEDELVAINKLLDLLKQKLELEFVSFNHMLIRNLPMAFFILVC